MEQVAKALIRLMASVGRLHRNDKLWGAVAEALVAAYALMSANGKLTSYRPYTDVDGKDLIIDLAGSFKDIYIQVKSAIGWNRYHRFSGTVRLHTATMSLATPAWSTSSALSTASRWN